MNKHETISLASEGSSKLNRKGARHEKQTDIKTLTPLKVLEEYQYRKEQGLMDESSVSVIDTLISMYSDKELPKFLIESIKNALVEGNREHKQ